MTQRVLICGNPDLNFIDGSSIWAQTIALAVAATGAQVDFMTRSRPARDELYGPLNTHPAIDVIDGSDRKYWNGKGFARVTPAMLGELAVRLDQDWPYDVIIVRGLEIAGRFLEAPDVLARTWMYLTDIPQRFEEYSDDQRLMMQSIARGCQRLLCQTEGFSDLWHRLVPDLEPEKVEIYSPVIPDLPATLPAISDRPKRAIYAGKFKGDWMTLEMVQAWPAIYNDQPDSDLIMIGDKIHSEPDRPDYQQNMQQLLENTPGVQWLGAQSRETVQMQLQQARVGLSWRHESMNDTVEYSTKILEYGGAGCAAILNRNPLHERLLGVDYPLFANSDAEFSAQLSHALTNPEVTQKAADALRQLAQRHTFSERVSDIRQWLSKAPKAPAPDKKIKVLVAGHDLKFFLPLQKKLEATGKFEFLIDQWKGHNKHDEAQSLALLKQVDVIFCEWCLGNLKWYSHHKNQKQILLARFHAQEIRAPYMRASDWDKIDHISFVSEHMRRQALEVFSGFPASKTSVISNYLDDKKFTTKNKTGDARYTLGIVGVAPMSKRLDRAVDLLEMLLEDDNRYCLRVKGKHPLDYDWLLRRQDELEYYRYIFERINSNPRLRHKVIFDPPADDVNDWFTMVGFILSPSDFESFHMAIGEGMLTGARPIIWNWDGAAEIWGDRWIVHSIEEARQAVIEWNHNACSGAEAVHSFQARDIGRQWQKILLQGVVAEL